ncbi:hypothetical protein G5B40_05895 [Pikeienuella piscinae]|uniref:Uncharacterized protein n=1 Tax=Pikeienuella piscinae TaxID=2748098 RepID=A0A7L5BTQ1_9RHOB|nr:hypothetical protein [Pikeienuella piscinae]QIE55025.1 hypothetical protein G5B40_05895 [Pikeienuella piscinae]
MISGEDHWIFAARVVNKMLLTARTKGGSEAERPIEGPRPFRTDPNRRHVVLREIEKTGRG